MDTIHVICMNDFPVCAVIGDKKLAMERLRAQEAYYYRTGYTSKSLVDQSAQPRWHISTVPLYTESRA